jgi:hypothetical protein
MKKLERIVELVCSELLKDQRIVLRLSANIAPTTGYIQRFDYLPKSKKIVIIINVDRGEFNPPTKPATFDFVFQSKDVTCIDEDTKKFHIEICRQISCDITLPDPSTRAFAA